MAHHLKDKHRYTLTKMNSTLLNRINNLLNHPFSLSSYDVPERNSTLLTEILAGISTYLILAYIFILNPAILSKTGMDISAILFATVIASSASTLVMGFYAKLPFALAPGLEMNGFFAFVVCGTLGLSWQQALDTVFWSGVLCLIFTIIPARKNIIKSIPLGLETSIGISVGVFVATIGLHVIDVVIYTNEGFLDLQKISYSSFISDKAIILYVGLIISAILGIKKINFKGGMLVAIIVSTVMCSFYNITVDKKVTLSSDMFSTTNKLDWFSSFKSWHSFSVLLVFFIIDFFGSIGKFIGLTSATNLQQDGKVINIGKAMGVDAGGTMLGAIIGTSSIITYVESAVGIASGGRTGITAIVCGFLMLLSLLFTPLVGLVPIEATTGILVYVGWLLLPIHHEKNTIEYYEIQKRYNSFDIVISLFMGFISLYTFSLDKAMLFGFFMYTVKQTIFKVHRTNEYWYLVSITILLIIAVVAQYVWK